MGTILQEFTQIDFYYWSDQCPYNSYIRKTLSLLNDNPSFSVNTYDISIQPCLAEQVNMYSPTLLIFNNKVRWNGPITLTTIQSIAKGTIPNKKPYIVDNSNNLINGTTKSYTEETVLDTFKPCGCVDMSCCLEKAKWIQHIKNNFQIPHIGILHYFNNSCVGGAEFVPSLAVPYAIPKGENIAFLTCSFLSDSRADYRSLPLKVLERELPKFGFKYLMAIASEKVVFPNGTLQWFINRGYEDLGEINYEELDFARMHLIKKEV